MKRVMLGLFAVAMIAGSANAATLSLRWANLAGDKIMLAPSQTAEIEVVLETSTTGNDTVSTLFFSLEAGPVTHLSNTALIPGWNAGGAVNLPFGQSQFAVASVPAGGPDDITGAGTFVVGSFVIRYDDVASPIGTEFEVAFDAPGGLGDPNGLNNQVVKSDGSFYTFTANAASFDYSGYFTFGKGSPGVTVMMDSIPRDPLIITKVPEPASLAILALGGFAAIMRRRS